MHIKLTDTVVHKHPKIPGILRDSILTGFGVGIYTSGKGLIHHRTDSTGSNQIDVTPEKGHEYQAVRIIGKDRLSEIVLRNQSCFSIQKMRNHNFCASYICLHSLHSQQVYVG